MMQIIKITPEILMKEKNRRTVNNIVENHLQNLKKN